MSHRLSIITPVFNGVRFMEFCIRNVISQDCPEAEHIIVDGGSTDGTVEVVRRYAEQYPHIRWVSEPDRGQSDAMNKGLAMASGEIVSFLNVDDYYEPGALNEALALFGNLPEPALLVGGCNIWGDDGNLQGVGRPSKIGFLNMLCGRLKAFPMNPSSYFYHRSLHDSIGPYDVEEHYVMDFDFLFRAVQAARVQYVGRTLGNMRYLPGTKTFEDVACGQNRIRSAAVLDRYRAQAPVHYRLVSAGYVRLVKIYKRLFR
jgi:glycosyltransferase involved in cell wall biosynthesis